MSPGLALVALLVAATPGGEVQAAAAPDPPRDVVVLLHGMGRTRRSMRPVEEALRKAGYDVINYGYRSRRGRVADHGEALIDRLAQEAAREDVRRIHFVGHSLGNIVIRWALAHGADRIGPDRIGRVVMLAPPNGGSRRADFFSRWMSWLSRPLADLTTATDSTARTIPPIEAEVGVIAGSRDGLVSVDESRLQEMTDHIVVRSGHTFIMRREVVIDLTKRFLRTGRFTGDD